MNIQPIRSEADYEQALDRIDTIFEAKKGTIEFDELEILTLLVVDYETKHHPIGEPDPIEYIKFRMEQLNLNQKDVAKWFGGANRVSEVLNRKRSLTLKMIRTLHQELKIPAETLLSL